MNHPALILPSFVLPRTVTTEDIFLIASFALAMKIERPSKLIVGEHEKTSKVKVRDFNFDEYIRPRLSEKVKNMIRLYFHTNVCEAIIDSNDALSAIDKVTEALRSGYAEVAAA